MSQYDQYLNIPFEDEIAEFRKRQQELGFTFPLSATSLGRELISCHARRLSLMDTAALNELPTEARQTLYAGIKEVRAEQKRLERSGDNDAEPQDVIEMSERYMRLLPAADAYCRAAFIVPRLAKDRAEKSRIESQNPGLPVWLIDTVHPEDRISFYMACSDSDSDQANLLKPFRPSGAIETQGTVEPSTGTTATASRSYADSETANPSIFAVGTPNTGV